MNLEIIQDKEYLKKQIFKTPAKILLNSLAGYYFLTEDRAKNYCEHVIGMIKLQCPDKTTRDICVDLMNKYAIKLETYKSKGDKKEKNSVIMLLLFIMVALLFIGLFIIVIWYKSTTLIYMSLLISTCIIFYFTSVYSSSNNKKTQVLENVLSSLNEIVESYNLIPIRSDQEVAKDNILSILKFLSEKKCVKLNLEIASDTFNPVSDLGYLPMTSIVRILRILEELEKIEFIPELKVNEFAKIFASHFKINGRGIKAKSFEATFNNLSYDTTRCDLNKINKTYRDALSAI